MAAVPFFYNALDTTGKAESGARIYTYIKGTSTPLTAYTDSALSVPAANPYTANAAGVTVLYLDGGESYSVYVKTADDASDTLQVDIDASSNAFSVSSYAALKSVNGRAGAVASWSGRTTTGDGGEGQALWLTGNQSAKVSSDPGQIIFVPPNSDATGASGVWKRIVQGPVLLPWAGVTADDSTDCAQALSRCLALVAAGYGSHVEVPRINTSWWRFSTQVEAVENVPIVFNGNVRAAVSGSNQVLKASGTEGDAVTVSSVSSDGLTISVGSGDEAGFTVGGYVRIYSDDVFDDARTDTTFAEIRRVESTADGEIVVEAPFRLSYATNIEAVPVDLFEGFRVEVNGLWDANPEGTDDPSTDNNRFGILAFLCKNPIIRGARGNRFDRRFIGIEDCVGGRVENIECKLTYAASLGYAASIIGCCYGVVVEGLFAEEVRHAGTSNNTSTRGGLPSFTIRDALIIGSPLTTSGVDTSPLDTHAAAFEIIWENIDIYGASGQAINVEAPFVTMRDVRVHGGKGVYLVNYSSVEAEYRLDRVSSFNSESHGIEIRALNTANVGKTSVWMSHPKVENANGISIYLHADTADDLEYVSIEEMNVEDGQTASIGTVVVDGALRGKIKGGRVKNALLHALRLDDTKNFLVDDLYMQAGEDGVEGVQVTASGAGNSTKIRVKNSQFDANGFASTTALRTDNNATAVTADESNDFSSANDQYNMGNGGGHQIPAEQRAISESIASNVVSVFEHTRFLTVANTGTINSITAKTGHTLKAGHELIVQAASATVTLADGAGNLDLTGGNYSLDAADKAVKLVYDGTNWNLVQ